MTAAETLRASRAASIARTLAAKVRSERDLVALLTEWLDLIGDPLLRFPDSDAILREIAHGAWVETWPDEANALDSYLEAAPTHTGTPVVAGVSTPQFLGGRR